MADFESKYFKWPPEWLENFTMWAAGSFDGSLPEVYIQCCKPTCPWSSESDLDMQQAYLQMYQHWKKEHTKADIRKSPEQEKSDG